MKLDTPLIQRLRDRLLKANPAADSADTPGTADPDHDAALERLEPLIEALFLTMHADDDVAPGELQAIANAIGVLSDQQLSKEHIDDLLQRLAARLDQEGSEARLEAVASRFALDKQEAEDAFTLCAVIALSDGRIDASETALAEKMRRYFGISAARARALLGGEPDSGSPQG